MEEPVNRPDICATNMHHNYVKHHIPEQFQFLVLVHSSLRLPELEADNRNPSPRTQQIDYFSTG